MRRAFFFILVFLWALPCSTASSQTAASAGTPQQDSYSSYYVWNGKTLEAVNGDPAGGHYADWQVWLYPKSMRVTGSSSGLAYARWGSMHGPSARAVMKQLEVYQQFERAYTNFFGANSWGRFSFSNPVGPVAVSEQQQTDDPNSLHWKVDLLNQRLESVVPELRSSLVNGEGNEAPALVQQYFERVRNSMQDVARFYDKLSRLPAERNYLSQQLARLAPGVDQAEGAIRNVTAILPTVKLPVDKDWMKQTEFAGRDGTINVTVTEIGSSAWVQQSWTGGDGSMAGTKIITIVPYQDIGTLDVWMPHLGNDERWTLHIQPANRNGFLQSVTSPERVTSKRTYPAVNLKTSGESVYLEFSDSRQAHEAYAFFLYHKERGT
jgi:hypothetical protein